MAVRKALCVAALMSRRTVIVARTNPMSSADLAQRLPHWPSNSNHTPSITALKR